MQSISELTRSVFRDIEFFAATVGAEANLINDGTICITWPEQREGDPQSLAGLCLASNAKKGSVALPPVEIYGYEATFGPIVAVNNLINHLARRWWEQKTINAILIVTGDGIVGLRTVNNEQLPVNFIHEVSRRHAQLCAGIDLVDKALLQ